MKSSIRELQSNAAPTRADLVRELAALGSPARAAGVAKFFKSGVGEYGEATNSSAFPCRPCEMQRCDIARFLCLN